MRLKEILSHSRSRTNKQWDLLLLHHTLDPLPLYPAMDPEPRRTAGQHSRRNIRSLDGWHCRTTKSAHPYE